MLDRPDPVEAHLLGEHGLLDAITDRLMLPLDGGMGQLRFEDQRELHGESAPLTGPGRGPTF